MTDRHIIEQVNKEIRLLLNQIQDGEAEIDWLRRLVRMAYVEGWDNAEHPTASDFYSNWLKSETRAALQPKEGNQ
jgi:hypothetical protein